jgi:hypothetical protein
MDVISFSTILALSQHVTIYVEYQMIYIVLKTCDSSCNIYVCIVEALSRKLPVVLCIGALTTYVAS